MQNMPRKLKLKKVQKSRWQNQIRSSRKKQKQNFLKAEKLEPRGIERQQKQKVKENKKLLTL